MQCSTEQINVASKCKYVSSSVQGGNLRLQNCLIIILIWTVTTKYTESIILRQCTGVYSFGYCYAETQVLDTSKMRHMRTMLCYESILFECLRSIGMRLCLV